MKRRIKAVETIKKVTHAMRLISMSTHTKLQEKRTFLTAYKNAFESLWASMQHRLPTVADTRPMDPHPLIILVGSQKGLVGTFNTNLFRQLEKDHHSLTELNFIGIGKHAIDYLNRKKATILATYKDVTVDHFVSISQAVTDILVNSPLQYPSTFAYSNFPKSFFIQQPMVTKILPLVEPTVSKDIQKIEYSFEQSPEELRDTLRSLLISVTLQELLYSSILSEQAARFISMDASTRNAENLLTDMKLDYNKLRQASITRELTELTATL
jgi:F-type H+-transporting ATPase subunit gamma